MIESQDLAFGEDKNIETITLIGDDVIFLRELAHKRIIQEKDGCVEPVFWMIQDEEKIFTDDGEYLLFFGDGEELYNTYDNYSDKSLEKLKEYILDNDIIINSKASKEIKKIKDNDDLLEFVEFYGLDMNYRRFTTFWKISNLTGPFLTKDAAKEHITENSHHYSKNVRTFGMVGWRNPEFERLMSIVSKFDVSNEEETNENKEI